MNEKYIDEIFEEYAKLFTYNNDITGGTLYINREEFHLAAQQILEAQRKACREVAEKNFDTIYFDAMSEEHYYKLIENAEVKV